MRIVVAMSGGVDFVGRRGPARRAGSRRHRSVDAARTTSASGADASAAAARSTICTTRGAWPPPIGIPHYIVNFERQFQRARSSRTSSTSTRPAARRFPCAHCNSDLKFATLLDRARGLRRRAGRHRPLRAASSDDADGPLAARGAALDREKDQSYFLFSLTQDQLARAVFPVGRSDEGRRARAGAAARPARRRQAGQPGDLLRARRRLRVVRRAREPARHARAARSSTSAATARTHGGVHRFTIGQRKGLGVAGPGAALRAEDRGRARRRSPSVPAPRSSRRALTASGVNWIACDAPADWLPCLAQIRHRHRAARGRVRGAAQTIAPSSSSTSRRLPCTPGQACRLLRR